MIDPPIHTEYFLSGISTTLTFILDGVKFSISFCSLSIKPANSNDNEMIILNENQYYTVRLIHKIYLGKNQQSAITDIL